MSPIACRPSMGVQTFCYAAPYAPSIGQPESGDLLQQRIHRVLAIAQAYGHTDLVLGAWGCGAFGKLTAINSH